MPKSVRRNEQTTCHDPIMFHAAAPGSMVTIPQKEGEPFYKLGRRVLSRMSAPFLRARRPNHLDLLSDVLLNRSWVIAESLVVLFSVWTTERSESSSKRLLRRQKSPSFAIIQSAPQPSRCDKFIAAVQASKLRDLNNPPRTGDLPGRGALLVQPEVSPRPVVITEIKSQSPL